MLSMCFQGLQLMLSNPLDMDPRRQFALQNKGTSAPQSRPVLSNTLQGFTWQPLVTIKQSTNSEHLSLEQHVLSLLVLTCSGSDYNQRVAMTLHHQ